MLWNQTKLIDGDYRTNLRFKCNRCGTTQEIAPNGSEEPLPEGWILGPHEGWHFCPGCETRKKPLLPVLN